MPVKSKAQLRWLYAAEDNGKVPKGTVKRWLKHTKTEYDKLKERVMNKKSYRYGKLNKQAAADQLLQLLLSTLPGAGVGAGLGLLYTLIRKAKKDKNETLGRALLRIIGLAAAGGATQAVYPLLKSKVQGSLESVPTVAEKRKTIEKEHPNTWKDYATWTLPSIPAIPGTEEEGYSLEPGIQAAVSQAIPVVGGIGVGKGTRKIMNKWPNPSLEAQKKIDAIPAKISRIYDAAKEILRLRRVAATDMESKVFGQIVDLNRQSPMPLHPKSLDGFYNRNPTVWAKNIEESEHLSSGYKRQAKRLLRNLRHSEAKAWRELQDTLDKLDTPLGKAKAKGLVAIGNKYEPISLIEPSKIKQIIENEVAQTKSRLSNQLAKTPGKFRKFGPTGAGIAGWLGINYGLNKLRQGLLPPVE